jgi:hypothetical protein
MIHEKVAVVYFARSSTVSCWSLISSCANRTETWILRMELIIQNLDRIQNPKWHGPNISPENQKASEHRICITLQAEGINTNIWQWMESQQGKRPWRYRAKWWHQSVYFGFARIEWAIIVFLELICQIVRFLHSWSRLINNILRNSKPRRPPLHWKCQIDDRLGDQKWKFI